MVTLFLVMKMHVEFRLLGGREHMFYALLYDFQVTVMSQRVKFKSNTCISLERMGRKAKGLKDV